MSSGLPASTDTTGLGQRAPADHGAPLARRADPARRADGTRDHPRPPRRPEHERRSARPREGLARAGRGTGPAVRSCAALESGAARSGHVSPAHGGERAMGARLDAGRRHRQARDRPAEHRAPRYEADERRRRCRPRLQTGLVPLRRDERLHRDDGRRSLLARLQRRRVAGPVRRQLVLRRRPDAVAGARRPPANGSLRERRTAGSTTSAPRRTRTSPSRAMGAQPPT